MSHAMQAVVWDIGGVLLDWNPRYLYRKLFSDEAQMERFLAEVCTLEWHAAHDRGEPFATSCGRLAAQHPELREEIIAWGRRNEEMEGGEIAGSVAVLEELRERGLPCYGLTNMEQETFPRRMGRYGFMRHFAGIVVSYQEGVIKPEREIFVRLLDRYGLDPHRLVFIDDSERNLHTGATLGMTPIRFTSPEALRHDLAELGLVAAVARASAS